MRVCPSSLSPAPSTPAAPAAGAVRENLAAPLEEAAAGTDFAGHFAALPPELQRLIPLPPAALVFREVRLQRRARPCGGPSGAACWRAEVPLAPRLAALAWEWRHSPLATQRGRAAQQWTAELLRPWHADALEDFLRRAGPPEWEILLRLLIRAPLTSAAGGPPSAAERVGARCVGLGLRQPRTLPWPAAACRALLHTSAAQTLLAQPLAPEHAPWLLGLAEQFAADAGAPAAKTLAAQLAFRLYRLARELKLPYLLGELSLEAAAWQPVPGLATASYAALETHLFQTGLRLWRVCLGSEAPDGCRDWLFDLNFRSTLPLLAAAVLDAQPPFDEPLAMAANLRRALGACEEPDFDPQNNNRRFGRALAQALEARGGPAHRGRLLPPVDRALARYLQLAETARAR